MVLTADQKKQIQQIKGFDSLKEEYDKRMKGSGKMRGRGFWEDMWGAIKQVAGNVNTFLKNTKVISKAGKLAKFVLPELGFAEAVPVAEAIGSFAETQGYGKKRKRVRGMGLSAMPITAGTKNKKSVLKTVMSDQMTVSQNGQFQQVPKLVGAGAINSMKGNGVNQLDVSPSTYNMISTNTKMKIKK